jgi:hypothetical protein
MRMGIFGPLLAVFAGGYLLGVWAAFLVLRQPQSEPEGVVVRVAPLSKWPE